jgi:hypothetical protein
VVRAARSHGEGANPRGSLVADHSNGEPVEASSQRTEGTTGRIERAATAPRDCHGTSRMITVFVGQHDPRQPLEIDAGDVGTLLIPGP